MDRLVVTSGRMPNPDRRYEVAVTADAARLLRVHLGSKIPLGVVGDVQSTTNCQKCKPTFHAVVTVVGIVTTSAGLIVDDADRSPTIFATPAFTKPLLRCCADPTISFLQISGGSRNVAAVETKIAPILPRGLPKLFSPTASVSEAVAQRVISPEAIALGVFGLIVALVTLIIAVQLLGRQLRLGTDELEVVRALGAGPTTTSVDGLIGVVGAVVVGAVVAVTVVVATLTFGSSLNTLVQRPSLYGWNWNVVMSAAGGVGVMPLKQTVKEFNADNDVAAWSGVDFAQLQIDGKTVAVLGESPGAAVAPPLLSGHGFDSKGQVVLGSVTLAQLHKRVGGTVRVSDAAGKSTTLRIVGTATFPAIGGQQHTELGTGALLDYRLIPKSARNLFNLPGGGPNAVFVRLKTLTNAGALARLNKIALVLQRAAMDSVGVVGVERPAEIANAGTLRATPLYLASALAASAVVALGLTLNASVRRRRRDLALLKALGFTQRQLAAAVAWQATVAAVIGLAFGIPIGIVVGRELWTLFARSINVVPEPTVPVLSVILVSVGALVFANVVALLPGRSAARTSAALVLRAE